MMRGVGESPSHDPGSRTLHVEKGSQRFPPTLVGLAKAFESLAAVLRIPLHEFQSHFPVWKGRRADINPQHVPEPRNLADALVPHLFLHTSAAWIIRSRPHGEVIVFE